MLGRAINFHYLIEYQLMGLLFRYREKFGFPFVICARQNKKEAILKGISLRLNNTAELELETGIEEVKKICLLRLQNIVQSEVPQLK